jgi:hypothetical protein
VTGDGEQVPAVVSELVHVGKDARALSKKWREKTSAGRKKDEERE